MLKSSLIALSSVLILGMASVQAIVTEDEVQDLKQQYKLVKLKPKTERGNLKGKYKLAKTRLHRQQALDALESPEIRDSYLKSRLEHVTQRLEKAQKNQKTDKIAKLALDRDALEKVMQGSSEDKMSYLICRKKATEKRLAKY